MDFIDKKEELANIIEEYTKEPGNKEELLEYINNSLDDSDFKSKELFVSILNELNTYLDKLSNKELKQRVMMIRNYID